MSARNTSFMKKLAEADIRSRSMQGSLLIPTSPPPEANAISTSVQTPGQLEDPMECESTLAGNSDLSNEKHGVNDRFESIAAHVNKTLHELSQVYTEIGYSAHEINVKQDDVFLTLDDTISSISSNALREKNLFQNECEWLRQQIRFILAMLNDSTGERTLKVSSRGIVFSNNEMYVSGYKDDVKEQIYSYRSFGKSPFSEAANDLPSDDFSAQQQYEYMIEHIPELTLLQTKTSLNSIFLDVLKAFVKVFRKFSELTVTFWENMEILGVHTLPQDGLPIIRMLPSRSEAETYATLCESFENVVRILRLSEKNPRPPFASTKTINDDGNAFIISSPRKSVQRDMLKQQSSPILFDASLPQQQEELEEDSMSRLREINGQLVKALRNLKVIKLTPQVNQELSEEVERSTLDISVRKVEVKDSIAKCLQFLESLLLSDSDLVNLQQKYIQSEGVSVGPFGVEALRLIESDPLAFGLEESNLEYLKKMASLLHQLRDSKQKKWDYMMNACSRLWQKLDESPQFIEQFTALNSSLTDKSLANLKMELNRLLMRRSEFIGSFIVDARKEIDEYHRLLQYSESQKQEFLFYDYDPNEESDDKEHILNLHEAEVEKLRQEYEAKEPILKLYGELNELLDDQKFLEESSKDSSRLLQKDSCKILMREERIRKNLNKNLPRIIRSLKEMVVKFNNEQLDQEKKPFMISGEGLYEKVLLIESEALSQKRPKMGSRTVPLRKPGTSPTKSVSPGRGPSPAKQPRNRSPMRIYKDKPPMRASQPRLGRTPSTISPERSHRNPTFSRSRNNTTVSSTSSSGSNGSVTSGTHLQPLTTPLQPGRAGASRNGSPEESTLYSMCSRISPLKDSTNVANFSPLKPDKFRQEREKSNMSQSLANSTVISDVNDDWREERLEELRHQWH